MANQRVVHRWPTIRHHQGGTAYAKGPSTSKMRTGITKGFTKAVAAKSSVFEGLDPLE